MEPQLGVGRGVGIVTGLRFHWHGLARFRGGGCACPRSARGECRSHKCPLLFCSGGGWASVIVYECSRNDVLPGGCVAGSLPERVFVRSLQEGVPHLRLRGPDGSAQHAPGSSELRCGGSGQATGPSSPPLCARQLPPEFLDLLVPPSLGPGAYPRAPSVLIEHRGDAVGDPPGFFLAPAHGRFVVQDRALVGQVAPCLLCC